MTAAPWLTTDLWRLHGAGIHMFPAGENKRPRGLWRNGPVDYVEVQPTDAELATWYEQWPPGWCALCGGPRKLACYDVEDHGLTDTTVKGEVIRAELDRFPDWCRRPSPSGGAHAWVEITEGDAPTGTGCKLVWRVDEANPKGVLLAEYRGHGQYALLLGHGRGPLPEDWRPFPMTRAEWDAMTGRLRAVSDPLPKKTGSRRRDGTAPKPRAGREPPEPRDWTARPPKDTGDVLARCLVEGSLSWRDVLEPGWEEVGTTRDRWTAWLRPDYGNPPTSEHSAKGAELRGHASLTVHSSSVWWADPGENYSPAAVLQLSGRLGDDVTFGYAMRAVEEAAEELVTNGVVPGPEDPLHGWSVEVLKAVAEHVTERSVGFGTEETQETEESVADDESEAEESVPVSDAEQRFKRLLDQLPPMNKPMLEQATVAYLREEVRELRAAAKRSEEMAAARGPRLKRTGREFLKVPPPQVILEDVFGVGPNLVGGPPGAGKSLFVRDAGLAVAAGVSWRRFRCVQQRDLLWVASEGLHDFALRFGEHPLWNAAADRVWVLNEPVDLTSPEDVDWLLARYADERPGVVVFDVIYAMGMLSDDGTKSVLPVMTNLQRIAAEWEAAVIPIGHPPLDRSLRRFRGSGAWRDLALTEYHLANGLFTCEKSKLTDASRLANPYFAEYPTLRWIEAAGHVLDAAAQELLIVDDFTRHPDDSDRMRAARLAPLFGLSAETTRQRIRTYRTSQKIEDG